MRKIVTTEMTDKEVIVVVKSLSSDSAECFTPDACSYAFPFSLVNPRIALQIATLLVSDPTIPQSDE